MVSEEGGLVVMEAEATPDSVAISYLCCTCVALFLFVKAVFFVVHFNTCTVCRRDIWGEVLVVSW